MPNQIFLFLTHLWSHWSGIVTSSVVSIVMLVLEKRYKKPLTWGAVLFLMIIGLLISCFAAWRDQYTSAEWRGQEIVRLTQVVADKDAAIQSQKNSVPNWNEILRQLVLDTRNLPATSLRKKTVTFTQNVVTFLQEQGKQIQEIMNSGSRPGEGNQETSERHEHDINIQRQETVTQFKSRYGETCTAIVKEIINQQLLTGGEDFSYLIGLCQDPKEILGINRLVQGLTKAAQQIPK